MTESFARSFRYCKRTFGSLNSKKIRAEKASPCCVGRAHAFEEGPLSPADCRCKFLGSGVQGAELSQPVRTHCSIE